MASESTVRIGALPGSSDDQRPAQLSELAVGPLNSVDFCVDRDMATMLRAVVERIGGRKPCCPEDQSYGCATGMVAIMKTQLGGRWPDATLHVRQELTLHRACPAGTPLRSTGCIESIEDRHERAKVVLASTAVCDDTGVADHRMTLYWPRDRSTS